MSLNPYQLAGIPDEKDLHYPAYQGTQLRRVAVLGGCMSQFAADALQRISNHNGFGITVDVAWPTGLSVLDGIRPELIVLQLSTDWLLGPLWDGSVHYDDEARAEMVEFVKEACTATIGEVRARASGSLLLVHGFSRPMVSPLGIHDFRHAYNFDRIVFELNEHLRALLRDDLGAMYLDEERIFSNAGKARLLDHMLAPFSHHGAIDMEAGPMVSPTRAETFDIRRSNEIAWLLAREYLDHYIAWKGTGRIKCVIVDLDDILWPLAVGENGFNLDDPELQQSLMYGVWAGIHQALGILKKRGVLLAVASRNSPDVVMPEWQRLADWCSHGEVDHLLRPDDFVLHEINWGPKSESIGRILSALGIIDSAALFIDDSPVERGEVRSEFPGLLVMGENINLVRGQLLTHPRLQVDKLTSEAAMRTTLVKAQLTREATRVAATSSRQFFESLGIVIRVKKLAPGDSLHRCAELMQRTNQFNISMKRSTVDELQDLLGDPAAGLYVLEVSDRFGAYGTVGLCIVRGDEVTDFVLSCRVLNLRPELPFLRAVLLAQGRPGYRGQVVEGPRNQPCRMLFSDAGFRRKRDGEWELESVSQLTPVNPEIYQTVMVEAASGMALPAR